MSENVIVPRPVWENVLHDLAFLKKAILPLAKGYKPTQWMSADEVQEYLNIGASRLKQLKASGMFRYQKPANGKTSEYWRKDIQDYKEGRIVLPPSNKKTAGGTAASL